MSYFILKICNVPDNITNVIDVVVFLIRVKMSNLFVVLMFNFIRFLIICHNFHKPIVPNNYRLFY